MPSTAQGIIQVLFRPTNTNKTTDRQTELGNAIIIFTCMKAVAAQVRCRRVRLLRLLITVEHDEPVVDECSDSFGEGTTISISVSVSKISFRCTVKG
jgi:hypothetical protein